MTPEHAVTVEASVTSKNLSKVALLRVAQYPFIALFAILVPRLMGPTLYGHYALFVSIVGMGTALLDLGMTEISARMVPELQQGSDQRAIRTFFSRMLGFKIPFDLLAIALGVLVFWVLQGARPQYLVPLLLAIFIGDLGGAAYGLLFGLNRPTICSLRDPLRRAAGLVIVLVLFRNFGLGGAISSAVFVECLLALFNFWWIRRYISPRELVPDFSYTLPLLRYGLLFYLSWGVTNLWQRLGNTLISSLYGDFREIALFDLSNQIFLTAVGFTMFLITALAPMFTRLRLDGKDGKIVDWSRRIITYSQIVCVAGLAAWLLIGDELIRVLIGPQYNGLYANVAILLCGTFPMVVVQLGLTLAMAYASPGSYLIALCVAVASFVGASFVLVPSYGALGCSAATALSCLCCALTIALRYRTNLRHSAWPGLKAIVLGAAVFAPCWIYRGQWIRNSFLLIGFVLAYGGALLLSRVIVPREIHQAWRALRHRGA
jgi:O-antigen/teichoic acid export membrane protein